MNVYLFFWQLADFIEQNKNVMRGENRARRKLDRPFYNKVLSKNDLCFDIKDLHGPPTPIAQGFAVFHGGHREVQ